MLRRALAVAGPTTVVAYSLRQQDEERAEHDVLERVRRFANRAQDDLGINAVVRFSRAFTYGAWVALDYKLSLMGMDVKSEEYAAAKSKVDLRSAKRLLYVCQTHQGVWTKFGQYVASMVKIVPDEYTTTLSVLQDANPGVGIGDVEQLFQEEFGMPLKALFASFDAKPLAAASLAQVHKAQTLDGQTVAVKVQYPRLAGLIAWDVQTIHNLATLVALLFEDYNFKFLVPEFEASIKLELDFLQEATNAERTAKLFYRNRKVHIPRVRWDLSSRRVLTMEFIEGCKVTNGAALKKAGINPIAVADTISELFSHMVFWTGLVHCDPHAGNLLVRRAVDDPSLPWWRRLVRRVERGLGLLPNFEVVVLDWGMVRRLDETFRRSYCSLWRAFLTRDEELGREATKALGLKPEYFEILSLISVNRTPGSTARLGSMMPEAERKALREKYKDRQKYGPDEVRAILQSLPRDVLFVLRSNSLVRGLNAELGQVSGTRFRIFGSSAVVGLLMTTEGPLPPPYFPGEMRDFSVVLPPEAGGGRVIQRRRKDEMLRFPHAPVNTSTAAEAFLFGGEKRPVYSEIRRRILVADLRLRLYIVDKAMEALVAINDLLVRRKGRDEAIQKLLEKELQVSLGGDDEGQKKEGRKAG